MPALLMFVMNGQAPGRTQHSLNAKAKLQGIRRVIVWIDHGALLTGSKQAAERFIDCPESIDPSVLIQIVVVQTDTAAQHRLGRASGRICKAQSRPKRAAIVVR